MDWVAEGLLEGLPDERAREARRTLLDELHADGVGVEELKAAVAEDRLALLPVERYLESGDRYTAREVAEQAGLELDWLEASRRALGLAWPGPDERALSEDDLEAARMGRRYRDMGFDPDEALEVARVLGRGMARYAESTRLLTARTFLEPGTDEHELGRRFAAVAEQMVPLAGPWLQHVFALHLRQVLRNDAVTFEERTAGRLQDTRDYAIAFADIVGFTELGEMVELEELGGLAGRLTRFTGDLVEPPVRLVKVIGDAVMLVAPEPDPLLATAVELVEHANESEDFPPLRAGVAYGPAVNRWGDWFGSTVNLASRVTSRARPASVLVTEPVRERAPDGRYRWSFAGEKKFKGFSDPIRTFRARPAEDQPPE